MNRVAVAVFALGGLAAFAGEAKVSHPFLCADMGLGKVLQVDADGKVEWEYPAQVAMDVWRLPNGNILFSHARASVSRALRFRPAARATCRRTLHLLWPPERAAPVASEKVLLLCALTEESGRGSVFAIYGDHEITSPTGRKHYASPFFHLAPLEDLP